MTTSKKIYEQGNGFPRVGDFVASSDQLYCIVSIDSPIHTDAGAKGNYIYATVASADWFACAEGDEFAARVEPVA